jgi:2-hydroxy-3-keto-5-methylthiopentenyl-1-phosphate phosphatase
MTGKTRTLVQCDFDGTVTEGDASFIILDTFTSRDWRQLFRRYELGEISVGRFNTEAFSMVKADKKSLLEAIKGKMGIRPGFEEMVACCRRKGFRLVIVSNGLDFYIKEILKEIGLADIEVFAAKTGFHPEGLRVQYIGPDGDYLDSDFKAAYVKTFLAEGYRIVYLGNGASDLEPARQCHHIFAIGTLLERCKQVNLDCTPFADFNDVIKVMERW